MEFSSRKLLRFNSNYTLSNADLLPTETFIRSMDKVKARYSKLLPHLIVCPNKVPFGQKDFSLMAEIDLITMM